MNKMVNFLIACSGADGSILKREQCKTERGKYAGIGATVLFTGLFAFISGTYAIWRVFHTKGWGLIAALIIGLIWGLMIFNLDRFIVSSIRKTDNLRKQALKAAPRFILAAFISLVVAAPLEVGLFSDRLQAVINKAENDELEAETERIKQRIYGLDSLATEISGHRREIAKIDSLKREDPNSEKFRTLTARFETCSQNLEALRRRNGGRINQLAQQRSQVQREINVADQIRQDTTAQEQQRITAEQLYRQKVSERRTLGRQITALNDEIQFKATECSGVNGEIQTERRVYLAALDSTRTGWATQFAQTQQQRDENEASASEKLIETNKDLRASYNDNFIVQVEALWAISGSSVTIIKWLIVLLFLLVETAPIFVKLLSEEGPYDYWLVAEEERSRLAAARFPEESLAVMEQQYKFVQEQQRISQEHALQQYEERKTQETRQLKEHLATNMNLFTRYTQRREQAQQRVSDEIVERWEHRHRNGEMNSKSRSGN